MTFEGTIRRPHKVALSIAVSLLLLATSCGSDNTDDGAAVSTTTEAVSATSLPPVTTAPTTAPPTTQAPTTAASSPIDEGAGSEFCLAYYRFDDLLDRLDEPEADPGTTWDAMVLAVAEMSSLSPVGYENELSRTHSAFVEFQIVLAPYDYDVEAAEDKLETIMIKHGLDETPELNIDDYTSQVCTGELSDFENVFSGDSDSEFCVLSRHITDIGDRYPDLGTPEDTKAALAEIVAAMSGLQAAAPEEIVEEITFAAQVFEQFNELAQRGEMNFDQILETLGSDYPEEEMETIGESIDAYNQQVCETSW